MRTERRKFQIAKYFSFLISYFLFLVILVSCGRKGDPTLKSYEKPDPPSNLRAIHRESEIILLWDFPTSKEKILKGFYLMKSTTPPALPLIPALPTEGERGLIGSGGIFVKVAFFQNDKRSYIDKDFTVGSQYYYKIISQSLRGVLSIDSNVVQIEPKDPPPPPHKLVYKIEYNSLTLSWEDVGDEIFYNVYKSDKRGIYSLFPVNAEPIRGTSFRDRFDVKKTVYYTVRSLRGGVVRDEGPPSEDLEVSPLEFVPSRPEGLQAIAKEDGVYLIWTEASETWVTGYRVYREMDKKEEFILIGETPVPSYVDRENPSTKRNYRVTAVGPSNEGPPAEIRGVFFSPYR